MTASVAQIESKMFLIRGHKVMPSQYLAELYEVEPRTLNQAVKRNLKRFPEDFMFQLTEEEAALLRSQTVNLKTGRGQHAKYLPYAFTEQGIAMLSSVLHSERAISGQHRNHANLCAPATDASQQCRTRAQTQRT